MTQDELNFERIKSAIRYLKEHALLQPSLDEVAQHVCMSPFHFQRLFTEWAGISPKKFVQYTTLQHAKSLLRQPENTTHRTAHLAGYSSNSRLHDQFVSIEAMTPAQYRKNGQHLTIAYGRYPSPFGEILIASTAIGICYIAFEDGDDTALRTLLKQFPHAAIRNDKTALQQDAVRFFAQDWSVSSKIKLHLKGTPFQVKVWEALLTIPFGALNSYHEIATKIEQPTASRAVGSAIGKNPIAYLIPCHRVIQASGVLGGYMWGTERKQIMIGWESCRLHPPIDTKK